jgi:hypothetical protein
MAVWAVSAGTHKPPSSRPQASNGSGGAFHQEPGATRRPDPLPPKGVKRRSDCSHVGIDPPRHPTRQLDRLEQLGKDEAGRLAGKATSDAQVPRDVTEQPDVDDALRAKAVVAGAPRGDGERGVLDLEGEAPPVGEDDQYIRHLSVVHRFVIDLNARLGKGTPGPIADQVLAAQVVPACATLSRARRWAK